ncbi:MAG: YidC/Oxa1 family membrane protein insertase [Tissierellaceae bacterium]|nr:YidC/Oxa1 family membrane protein insertase [Tissierellaceae bacterium]
MTAFLGNILGSLLKFVYDMVSTTGIETEYFSYYAMAIILTTIIFKLLLLPVNLSQVKSSRKMNELQPLMKEIQVKYKNDPQTQQKKLQDLYKEHNYKPAGGCLILLIQMPIIFAFFAVFRDPARYAFNEPGFYEAMNKSFLWIANLDFPDPNLWGLPLLAALTTYLQSAVMAKSQGNADPQAQSMQKSMLYFLPIMIFFSARSFAGGLALYWVISNIFSIVQQLISNRSLGKVKEEK